MSTMDKDRISSLMIDYAEEIQSIKFMDLWNRQKSRTIHFASLGMREHGSAENRKKQSLKMGAFARRS